MSPERTHMIEIVYANGMNARFRCWPTPGHVPFLKKGAYIAAGNVTSHAKECQDYLLFLRNDKRFQTVTVEMGQGLELSRHLGSKS